MSSPNAASNSRRKSGRAVKVPDKFQPEAHSTADLTNGKRKRVADVSEDVENDIEVESDEVDASNDEEEDRPVRKRTKPAKKPAAKKAKTNGATSQSPEPVQRLPSRPKKAKKVAIADADAGGLYAEVFKSGKSSEEVAINWLKAFEEDNAIALKDLVNLILRSAGCEQEVTIDDINDPDNAPNKLNDMQDEERHKQVPDYPLIKKGSQAFRDALINFFDSLTRTIHASGVLYDEIALIENLHLWATTMSSSFLRPFRHTATVVSLSLATALCRVALEQAETNARTLRQLEGEKKKKASNAGRVKEFQQKLDQGNARRETCENTIIDFFDTVFVHRYRDVDPRIRTECVEALGQWMSILPGKFFEGQYLRYLGWILSDSAAAARLGVLKQLERVLENKNNVGGMRHFIERFRPRIVEMATRDAESSVRVAAIDLLDLIREAEMLEPDDIDTIGKLIFDSDAKVRKAVVKFFAENINDMYESKLEDLGGKEVVEDLYQPDDDDYESPRSAWITLKCLAEVFLNYDADGSENSPAVVVKTGGGGESLRAIAAESRFSLAAQALHETLPELQDWTVIAGYLLYDHSTSAAKPSGKNDLERQVKASFKLDEDEEIALLEVLYASVKLDLLVSDEHESKKKRSKANPQAQETARKLATLIPRLLKKFAANSSTTTAVLRLEQILNLDVFQQLRQDSTAYADLLHEITTQFSRHADQRVLSEASAALLHAKAYNELDDVTDDQMQALWDATLSDFRRRFPKTSQMTVRGDLALEPLDELANTMARIAKLASISNPIEHFEAAAVAKGKANERAKLPVIEMLLECAARGLLEEPNAEYDDTEDRLVTQSNRAALFYFMWKTKELKEKALDGIPDVDIDQVKEYQERFDTALSDTFSSRGDIDELRLVATGTFLELHVVFSMLAPKTKSQAINAMDVDGDDQYSQLRRLRRHVLPQVQKEITDIFSQTEKKFAKKARKTLEAPADDDEPEDLDSDFDDENEDATDADRKGQVLVIERQLCELTSKLVLAILAGVIDAEGPLKGKLRTRIQRNRNKLGHNFKEVIAFLDEPKAMAARKPTKKAQQAAAAAKKSAEMVEESEDEDEVPDNVEEDEVLDDEPPVSIVDDEEPEPIADEEDDVLGD